MLHSLLKILSEGGTYGVSEIAGRLDVREELVHEMIEALVRLGYLRSLAESCEQHCGQCAQSAVCSLGAHGEAWALTEEGKRAARSVDHGSR